MASNLLEEGHMPVNSTIVAIDKDKNSQYAVRWTAENLMIAKAVVIFVHVRVKNPPQTGNGDNDEANHIFAPIRGYCSRKGVQTKEVVLEGVDIARTLLDYVNKNLISNIVIGASSTKYPFTRSLRFTKYHDVPTSVLKSAPEFCSVYVISKGKVQTVRSAQRPRTSSPTKHRTPSPGLPPQSLSDSEHESVRGQRTWRHTSSERHTGSERSTSLDKPTRVGTRETTKSPTKLSLDFNHDLQLKSLKNSSSHNSASDNSDGGPSLNGSLDLSAQNLDFLGTPDDDHGPKSARDIEAEMRRLKLELKQTMDMYSSACKEALTATKKANELHQWKLEEARRFEEARLSEEAALATAEMEKAKCRAAMEAAEKARRMAELESQRRKHAETKAKKEAAEKDHALNVLSRTDVRYRRYTITEIEEATQRFSEPNKIGEGGYGPVYKGTLDHTPVAIKVLRPDAAQGKKQFQQEVEVLSCMRHPNMVLLLGACPEYGCLVYEFMDNGSLEDRLLCRGNTPPLSWRKRFKIAAEIATALLFLHLAKPEPLVHRDLKPANILVDRNYVSKISDVGLARLVPASVADSVTQYYMTSAAGTFCYIDPEYQQSGMLTTKSDVYSLGIMLLQIITAKPPMGLAHKVSRAIENGTFAELLDPVVPDWPVEEALAFAKLSLKCAELRKKDRPSLALVIVPELCRLRELGKRTDSNRGHNRSPVPRCPILSSSRTSNSSQESRSSSEDAETTP